MGKKTTRTTDRRQGAVRTAADGMLAFPLNCRLLRGLGEEGFRRICECMQVKERHLLDKEACIFEDSSCDQIGVVVSGAVRLTRRCPDGRRNVLEDVTANGVFGTTYAFRDSDTMGICVSAVGETTVLIFNTAKITQPCHKVCSAHVQFVKNLLAVMSQKTFRMRQKLRILSQRTIRGRLLMMLQMMAVQAKTSSLDLPYDRQALADYLCVDRSALSAELSKLRKEGVLACVRNHFELLHWAKKNTGGR